MLSSSFLYLRKQPGTPKREKQLYSCDDDNDNSMKKTVKSVFRPFNVFFSNEITKLLGFAFLVFIYVTLAVTFYQQYEGWSVTDSIFFVVQTLGTVGYGYPSPSSDNSRLFTIFFILIGIFVVFAGVQDFLYANIGFLRAYLCKKSTKQVSEDLASGDFYQHRKFLVRIVFGLVITVILAAIILKYNENFSWITAFYFIIETVATIGYGDVVLVHASSRQFTIAFIIVSATLVAIAIRAFSSALREDRELDKLETKLRRLQSLRFNKNIPVSSGDNISKSEIVLAMLCRTGVLNHATDVAPWLEKIDKVDISGRGYLTQQGLNTLLDNEANDATIQLDTIMQAKSFSVWSTIREIFSVNDPNFIDLSWQAGDHDSPSNSEYAIEMKDRNNNTNNRGTRIRDTQSDDDVDSPLAQNADSLA